MKNNYQLNQPEIKKRGELKFHHQIKCQGVCGRKTFIAKDGNRLYCDDCLKKLKKPKSKQTKLIKDEKKNNREKLLRLDQNGI